VNFEVSHVPTASIIGTVSGNVPSLKTVQLAIIPDLSPRVSGVLGTAGITSDPPDERGEFTYGNLPPGRYRIVARARGGPPDPNAPPSPAGVAQVGGGRGGAPPAGQILQAVGKMAWPQFAALLEEGFARQGYQVERVQGAAGMMALAFRPHQVRLDADRGESDLRGEVVDALYTGASVRYTVEIHPGSEVSCLALMVSGVRPLEVGQKVSLSVPSIRSDKVVLEGCYHDW